MNRHPDKNHYPVFVFGLVAGAALGGGLAMYFASTMGSRLRKRVAASAKDLGDTASEYYEQVSTHVVDAVEDLTGSGQKVRETAAGVVARGAREVALGAREVERLAGRVAKAAGKY